METLWLVHSDSLIPVLLPTLPGSRLLGGWAINPVSRDGDEEDRYAVLASILACDLNRPPVLRPVGVERQVSLTLDCHTISDMIFPILAAWRHQGWNAANTASSRYKRLRA